MKLFKCLKPIYHRHLLGSKLILAIWIVFCTFTYSFAAQQTLPLITNNAFAHYQINGQPLSQKASVSISQIPEAKLMVRTDSSIFLLRFIDTNAKPNTQLEQVNSTFCIGSNEIERMLPNPTLLRSGALSIPSAAHFSITSLYQKKETVFIKVVDQDQNQDDSTQESIIVTATVDQSGDQEQLKLLETGVNTGEFTGYVLTTSASQVGQDCRLAVSEQNIIRVQYIDSADRLDQSQATALVDPVSLVFNSTTGEPINGAVITLINEDKKQEASVLGDDGQSQFPAAVNSGSDVVDSSGQVYTFGPGAFAFPFINPGNYRFEVVAPVGFSFPSKRSDVLIQTLVNKKFNLTQGSRGEVFSIVNAPTMRVDIPLDPVKVDLFLTKAANKTAVSQGEFIQYRIVVENTDVKHSLGQSTVVDQLPVGLRYQDNSTQINGLPGLDPKISSNGRTLTFDILAIEPGKSVEIRYVVLVGSNAALGEALNSATAQGQHVATSNQAVARVIIQDDLFAREGTLMGRIILGSCDQDTSNNIQGVENVRVYLEDGRYVLSDQNGKWHIEGIEPGVHVLQLDTLSLNDRYRLIECENNARFASQSFSQFIDMPQGGLWRGDFYVEEIAPVQGEVNLRLKSHLLDPDTILYRVEASGTDVAIKDRVLTVSLPEQLIYQKGSSQLNGTPMGDPQEMGSMLIYRMENQVVDWSMDIRLLATPKDEPSTSSSLVTAKALLQFKTLDDERKKTPVAQNSLSIKQEESKSLNAVIRPNFDTFSVALKAKDKRELDALAYQMKGLTITQLSIVGHTDSVRIAPRSRHIFKDNYALSKGRANSVAEYLAQVLKLEKPQLNIQGLGPDKPVSSNKTAKGRSLNRRVELMVNAKELDNKRSIILSNKDSGIKKLKVESKEVAVNDEAATPVKTSGDFLDVNWLNQADASIDLLWPEPGAYPNIPSTSVVVKHGNDHRVLVEINGELVNNIHLSDRAKNSQGTVMVSRWQGLDLAMGDNTLKVMVKDQADQLIKAISRVVHVSGPAMNAQWWPQESKMYIDGQNHSVLAIRLTDRDGHPVRKGAIGEFFILPPYQSLQQVKQLSPSPVSPLNLKPTYQVEDNGITYIELAPTTESGKAQLSFDLADGRQKTVDIWLKPRPRDWIIVGMGDSTWSRQSKSGNREALSKRLKNSQWDRSGRAAVFAKGALNADWLMTFSYDSAKTSEQRFKQIVNPGTFFTLYGDQTRQSFEAASRRKTYVKLESANTFAMLGDFNTNFNQTELMRYDRSLTGVKADYINEKMELNAFVADTDQTFHREEMIGDGTSGFYRLNRQDIVINSENIMLETRDRFRSEVTLKRQVLTRNIDYVIDYADGTLFFKQPVLSKDSDLNPNVIVAIYELKDKNQENLTFGGRLAANISEQAQLGLNLINQDDGETVNRMWGLDYNYKINEKISLKAEWARSQGQEDIDGEAYILDVQYLDKDRLFNAYSRYQSNEFGIGQQRLTEQGTRKNGVRADVKLAEKWRLIGDAYRQSELVSRNHRDVLDSRISYTLGAFEMFGGFRYARDVQQETDRDQRSTLALAGGRMSFLDNRLSVRASLDKSLTDQNTNQAFPTRYRVGADFRVNSSISLLLEQEFTKGDQQDTQGTRVGFRLNPWKGATVNSLINRSTNENGERVFANTGLKQSFQYNPFWQFDVAFDRAQTLNDDTRTETFSNAIAPQGGLDSDFSALSLGTAYNKDSWRFTSRLEWRLGDVDDKRNIFLGVYHDLDSSNSLAGTVEWLNNKGLNGLEQVQGEARLGWAYRPVDSPFVILNRMDLRYDEQQAVRGFNNESKRFINQLSVNYHPNLNNQWSIQYGIKYVLDTIDQQKFDNFSDVLGLTYRHDINTRFDMGFRVHVRRSSAANNRDLATGLDLGFRMAKNLYLGVGYNFIGFKDEDFDDAQFRSKGVFFNIRFKVDQDSLSKTIENLMSKNN